MLKKTSLLLSLVSALVFSNTANAKPNTITKASYYADKFHGRTQANGKPFNMHAMTVAHKSLPFGTKLKVTNVKNNKSVIVTVTDRGPYIKGRSLDLSKAAFRKIASISQGVATIKYHIIK